MIEEAEANTAQVQEMQALADQFRSVIMNWRPVDGPKQPDTRAIAVSALICVAGDLIGSHPIKAEMLKILGEYSAQLALAAASFHMVHASKSTTPPSEVRY